MTDAAQFSVPLHRTAHLPLSRFVRRRSARLLPLMTLLVVLILWQLVVSMQLYPPSIVPAPLEVLATAADSLQRNELQGHILVTLQEVVLGIVLGVSLGATLGYAMGKVRWLETALSPVVVFFQSTPVVAYAPLLILWFGTGIGAKVLTATLIVFFPVLINVTAGIAQIPDDLRQLLKSMRATPWQMFSRLEVPASLPIVLAGLKTSSTLAVIGAVVGEFISASEGLGYLVKIARSQYDTALVFVAILSMTAISLSFYLIVSLVERSLLHWRVQS